VIYALAPDTAEEALAHGVRPRRPERRAEHRDPAGGRDPAEGRTVLAVAVVDEEPRRGALRRRLAQALLANRTSSTRSARERRGRLVARASTMSCWRRKAFSAMSSGLLRARSAAVASTSELAVAGRIQPAR